MSQEDVEIVRRFWDAVRRSIDVYWENPTPMVEALDSDGLNAEQTEMFGFMSPEVVWKPAYLSEERRGFREMMETWEDYLSWADDYRVKLNGASQAEGNRVLADLGLSYRAKAGGGMVEGPLYAVVEVDDGLITRIDEYTERADALEAAGIAN